MYNVGSRTKAIVNFHDKKLNNAQDVALAAFTDDKNTISQTEQAQVLFCATLATLWRMGMQDQTEVFKFFRDTVGDVLNGKIGTVIE